MQKKLERKSLIISTILSFFITISGLYIFLITNIKALFLDCLFSFIALLSSLSAVFITNKSKIKTKTYPNGLYFLEPLYAILKSLIILFLLLSFLVVVSINAYNYFVYRVGNLINIDIILPYTICMVIICCGLGFYNKIQNKKINNISTILEVESKANIIDGLQSLAIGISTFLLYFVDINGKLSFLHYTGDFFITAILVLISIKEPIKVLVNSFRELTLGTINNTKIGDNIKKIINNNLSDFLINKCYIFKIGTKIKIIIIIENKLDEDTFYRLITSRKKIIKNLEKYYEDIELIFEF